MSQAPNPPYALSAKFVGPILSLEGELTKNAQNLIFARNGTGKSFLSRAFRYLDCHRQGLPIDGAAKNLVSDESSDGKGAFSFMRGSESLGTLELEKLASKESASAGEVIFHVFSEEFVHDELRQREYTLDGEIENQITVDSTNIKLDEAKETVTKAQKAEADAKNKLNEKYNSQRDTELVSKANVSKTLSDYKALNLEKTLEKYSEKPNPNNPSFSDMLKDLDSLKAVPAEPSYPDEVDILPIAEIDIQKIESSLKRITSPSSTSEVIKRKIEAHHDFYETGAKIVGGGSTNECPFCEQDITKPGPKEVIEAYLRYFADEEELHKSELRGQISVLNRKIQALENTEANVSRQKARYDALKKHLPSTKETQLIDLGPQIEELRKAILATKDDIEKKTKSLATPITVSRPEVLDLINELNSVIQANNATGNGLKRSIAKSDDERKTLQRRACSAFETDFCIGSWVEIQALRSLEEASKRRTLELSDIERLSPSTDARKRVANTFELLLRDFFNKKYVFDKNTFTLRRGDREMLRGPHRTLSEGEKTAIAFCYFVACAHKKVRTQSDYRKLFFVFDDPVTSMSYDFVFSIAQTLKHLSISDNGDFSLSAGAIGANSYLRPNLIILTHSSYFFNIALANRVIKNESTFSLQADKGSHKIVPLKEYVAPFDHQLKEVFEVATDVRDPAFSTGNAIRSVLEAIGRFCRPDKSGSLSEFIIHLSSHDGFMLKSVLINSLSHGTYYQETPSPDDIKLACKEAVEVVEKYASGHLEILRR